MNHTQTIEAAAKKLQWLREMSLQLESLASEIDDIKPKPQDCPMSADDFAMLTTLHHDAIALAHKLRAKITHAILTYHEIAEAAFRQLLNGTDGSQDE